MYVLIDRENLVISHKHDDRYVVSLLGKIELSHCRALVLPVEENAFLGLTEMEIRLLYRHVTGAKISGTIFHSLLNDLIQVIKDLPNSDVNPVEVKYQADLISLNDSGFYRYVKGAYRPLKLDELFSPPPINTTTPVPVKPVKEPVLTGVPASKPLAGLPSWHPLYNAV